MAYNFFFYNTNFFSLRYFIIILLLFLYNILTNRKCAGSATTSSAATWTASFILGRLCECLCLCVYVCLCVCECKFEEKFPSWRYTSSVHGGRTRGEERACKVPGPDATFSGLVVVSSVFSSAAASSRACRSARADWVTRRTPCDYNTRSSDTPRPPPTPPRNPRPPPPARRRPSQ